MTANEESLEYDPYDVPGTPDLAGAIVELVSLRESIDDVVAARIDNILALLRPETKKAFSIPSFDHRGHWKYPDDAISITLLNSGKSLKVGEAWIYDRKGTYPDIWGRAIIDTYAVNALVDEEDSGDAYFDLSVRSRVDGESRFRHCVAYRFTTCDDIWKMDFVVRMAEDFGYSYQTRDDRKIAE